MNLCYRRILAALRTKEKVTFSHVFRFPIEVPISLRLYPIFFARSSVYLLTPGYKFTGTKSKRKVFCLPDWEVLCLSKEKSPVTGVISSILRC